MGKPNYRIVVSFDSQRTLFSARAPELEHLSGEGPTRKEAIARLEDEIDAQLANMLSLGSTPPKAIDEVDHTGEIHAKVSKGLHRELLYLANSEGVELDQMVSELLAAALAVRQGARAGHKQPRAISHDGGDDIGNRAESHPGHGDRDGNRSDGNRRPFQRGHNPQIMDDRANFIEYVRGLENGGGRGPGGHRNPGHGNNNNNNNRRRRGGGGGPGGPPQGGRDGNRHQGGQHRGPQQGRPQHDRQQHGGQQHGGQPHGGSHAAGQAAPPRPQAPPPTVPAAGRDATDSHE